ncbi:MAG: hypothetical protein EPN22_06885 [Nitrospirae bacterium]|nr:MAG: hypothetical protein EPN22_06885 [Nitrospirota bacterium]
MSRLFHMTILGRTIEHLGSQMYKHRAPSIAELVANCWDAGATTVWITMPVEGDYDPAGSAVTIRDNGEGMNENSVQTHYLVVGRNRRADDGGISHARKVMGRKGIGKLAGFGLAEKVTVTTWTPDVGKAIRFSMSIQQLKNDAGQSQNIEFPWEDADKDPNWSLSGTCIELSDLRHASPIDIAMLKETLARRFSRTTRGQMRILINEEELPDPVIESMYSYPEDGSLKTEILPNSQTIKYRYSYAEKPIRSKEMQGFVIYTNERTAQAPPFFFNVESTASGQHSTRYVTGEIYADYLDAGTDNESDVISTDRQELDWEKQELKELLEWGQEITRRIFRECADKRGQQFENWVLNDNRFRPRISLIDPSSQAQLKNFLKILGNKSTENDERTLYLADSLVRAYEFRTFHDVIDEIEEAGKDPDKLEEMLRRLHDWKVLESRAILEIVQGRLSIVNKLEQMIIHNAPETASAKTHDNLHDLLAEYPWLFNPEWQVFTEEKTISKQLREWGETDCLEDMKDKRIDFLAFAHDTDHLIIIELKRPGHPVEMAELQRLEKYQVELMRSRKNCRRVLVYGGTVNIPEEKWNEIISGELFEALEWSQMFTRAKRFYSHYQAVLEGDIIAPGFRGKEIEVARTREILETGSSHRSKEDRGRGVGSSDV